MKYKFQSVFKLDCSRKSRIIVFPLAVILGVAFYTLFITHHASALTFDPPAYTSDLIDDSVFRSNSSMTSPQIESFLQSEGSGLANFYDIADCSSNPSYMANYYPCGQSILAASIVYDAAQAYGINPRVILATLQKEQSLITTPNPAASQLNFAMGYGCPDSGSCSYPGFFHQVDWGTWQLRLNTELMSGNTYFGISPSSYACNGATRYYSAALKPGNYVSFKDDNGTVYNSFTLPNAATSSLYCYTPHVYNNPSGLYNLPAYGTTGLYYSGSYNFVYYYTLWWGSPSIGYSFIDSTGPPSQILPNDVVNVVVHLQNSSGTTWYSDGNVPTGGHPTRLAMLNYQNLPFANPADPAWLGTQNQVKMVEPSVPDGGTATFQFTLKGPFQQINTYPIRFLPVLDGVRIYTYIGLEWDTSTPAPNYSYQVTNSSGFTGNMPTNYTDAVSYTIKNTGNVMWFSDSGKAVGATPLRLFTTNPFYHNSLFYDSATWLAPNQISMSSSKVGPGGSATFSFNLKMPSANGTYSDSFGLVLDGFAAFPDTSQMPFTVNVADYSFSVISKDIPSNLIPGQKYTCKIVLQNTGFATWYSDGNTPTNVHAIRLMTAGYKNDPLADLSDPNWLGASQIKMITPSVAPGQSGEFDFGFVAPFNSSGYNNNFRLVLDGVWIVPGTINQSTSIPAMQFAYDAVNGTINPPLTMQKGQIVSLKLVLKNNTNFIWYNDSAKPSQFTGGAVRLVMTNPWYRSSPFANNADSAWLGTANQVEMATPVVNPGDLGEFDFTWKAPPQSGFYRERFAPVIDGYAIFPDIGMEFDTTVQ